MLADSTVGYGLPTGFTSQAATPLLAGVQCENCHGPAANHAASDMDPTVRPRVELAATVCGGCHTGPEHPTFEEWSASGHATVVAGIDLNSTNLIDSCGRCHSGSVRYTNLGSQPLPFGDADVGIVCATCHDPHQTNANPAQVRYPLASTNDYFVTTSGVFTNQVNPAINVCAQCHNHRGASWTNSAAPPHHSPQYNILLGTVGELASGLAHYQPGSHALMITNQCVGCHMQSSPYQGPAQPAVTGHTFTVDSYNLCLACHPYPEALGAVRAGGGYQPNPATGSGPQSLGLDQGACVPVGQVQRPRLGIYDAGPIVFRGPGPDASEQSLIPINIQKARFNLYLVFNDGSYGVHNSPYSGSLLDQASQWIQAELDDYRIDQDNQDLVMIPTANRPRRLPRDGDEQRPWRPEQSACWRPAFPASSVSRSVVMLPNVPGAKYIGSKECEQCHEEITRSFRTADHARLIAEGPNALGAGCESCHGPASLHSESGGDVKPPYSFTAGSSAAGKHGRRHGGIPSARGGDGLLSMPWRSAGAVQPDVSPSRARRQDELHTMSSAAQGQCLRRGRHCPAFAGGDVFCSVIRPSAVPSPSSTRPCVKAARPAMPCMARSTPSSSPCATRICASSAISSRSGAASS